MQEGIDVALLARNAVQVNQALHDTSQDVASVSLKDALVNGLPEGLGYKFPSGGGAGLWAGVVVAFGPNVVAGEKWVVA